jgi:polysaccharide export outer membrane protein
MSTKKVTYFQDKESVDAALSKGLYDAKIMPKDVLQIQAFSMTPGSAEPFNLLKLTGSATTTTTSGQSTIYDYLVDNAGNIEYPVVGTLHLAGLTKSQAEELIKSKIQPYLAENENIVVHVRMINYKYAVLGAVKAPGMFTTQNEKVSILEAIAQAGDLTTFAERDKIFLIREDSEGQKHYHQLDISKASIVNSPYYYLQQNDVVYVEPNNVKAQNSKVGQTTTLWFSATSILISLTSLLYNILK